MLAVVLAASEAALINALSVIFLSLAAGLVSASADELTSLSRCPCRQCGEYKEIKFIPRPFSVKLVRQLI